VTHLRKKWLVERYDQDLANRPLLIEELFNFIDNRVAQDSEYLSNNLRRVLTLYVCPMDLCPSTIPVVDPSFLSFFAYFAERSLVKVSDTTKNWLKKMPSSTPLTWSLPSRSPPIRTSPCHILIPERWQNSSPCMMPNSSRPFV